MGFVDSLMEIKKLEMQMLSSIDTSKVDGTFYYDETNNFRKFRLNKSGFNNDINNQSHFTLGGLFISKGVNPNIDDLIKKLRPQKNQEEFKFKFFSYGKTNIKDFLRSRRLKILFKWILNNDVLIHTSTMDYLFFSIVDIVDDLPDAQVTGLYNKPMKDILYDVVRKDMETFRKLLYKYKYPNLSTEDKFDFYRDVYNFYLDNCEYNPHDIDDFPKEMLRQMLKAGFKRDGNSFLEDNEDYLLVDRFETSYVNTPVNFPNCTHIFDEEKDIITRLEELEKNYSDLLNMTFKNSKEDIYIQLSDAIVGFSSKLDNVIYNNDFDGIDDFLKSLDYNQKKLIYDYLRLIVKSDGFCLLFTHATVPESYRSKYRYLLDEVVKVIQK